MISVEVGTVVVCGRGSEGLDTRAKRHLECGGRTASVVGGWVGGVGVGGGWGGGWWGGVVRMTHMATHDAHGSLTA